MTVANRGNKRRCPNCGAAYYDLNRTPVICPKCQTLYVEAQRIPVRSPRSRAEPAVPAEEPADDTVVFDGDETLETEEIDSDILRDEDQGDEDAEDRE